MGSPPVRFLGSRPSPSRRSVKGAHRPRDRLASAATVVMLSSALARHQSKEPSTAALKTKTGGRTKEAPDLGPVCSIGGFSLISPTKRQANRKPAGAFCGRQANGGASTSVPISRKSACCSGPFASRKNSPNSI